MIIADYQDTFQAHLINFLFLQKQELKFLSGYMLKNLKHRNMRDKATFRQFMPKCILRFFQKYIFELKFLLKGELCNTQLCA